MNLLLIHGNYPGQFRNLAYAAGKTKGDRVTFLTVEDYPNKWPMSGVEVITYKLARGVHKDSHHYLQATERAVLTGQAVLRVLHRLRSKGYQPDVIVYHAGNGLGLFVKDLFPSARCIGYFEWYFTAATSRYLFAEFRFDQQLATNLRNLPILSELASCDAAVTPTTWQKQQFPVEYQRKLQVIFDGIDLRFFSPDPLVRQQPLELPGGKEESPLVVEPHDLVLSYATRGMEPVRGFPQFMRMLPRLLLRFSQLKVVIAGEDRVAYSYRASSHGGSWKAALLAELAQRGDVDLSRIHFTGSLSYQCYRQLLRRTDLHCSFTRPYVMSWSVVEAAACGSPLALASGPATAIMEPWSRCTIDLDADLEEEAEVLQNVLEQRIQERLGDGDSLAMPVGSSLPLTFSLHKSLFLWRQLFKVAKSETS